METIVSRSEDIKEFVAALAKAQGAMKPAVFNKTNPHFKGRYADFKSCMDACRQPLADNGLAVVQYCDYVEDKLVLFTLLAHISGQWMKSTFPLVAAKMDSQGIGSAMTYAKRYSLCGMVGIVVDEDVVNDDDGETAVGRGAPAPTVPAPAPKPAPKPAPEEPVLSSQQVTTLAEMLNECSQEFKENFKKLVIERWKTDKLANIPAKAYQVVFDAILKNRKGVNDAINQA